MPKKGSSAGVDEQRARLGRGEQLEAGWCFDPDREEDVFKCGELEEAVVNDKSSVSFDGSKVVDLATGEVETRKARPMMAGTMTTPNAPVATSPTGGGGRGPAAGAGAGTTGAATAAAGSNRS
jgi:hypothetical protein